jgi:hypothetical protein
MRFFQKVKDGGPDSPVDAYVLIEIKSLFSIMLLKFNKGARDSFHSHAFNAWTLFLSGYPMEVSLVDSPLGGVYEVFKTFKSGDWKYTPKDQIHLYSNVRTAWAITFRGPWSDTWKELTKLNGNDTNFDWRVTTLRSPGREVVKQEII